MLSFSISKFFILKLIHQKTALIYKKKLKSVNNNKNGIKKWLN